MPNPHLKALHVDAICDPSTRGGVAQVMETIFAGEDRIALLVDNRLPSPVELGHAEPCPQLQGEIDPAQHIVVAQRRAGFAGEC